MCSRSHTFVDIDHEIIFSHSPPSTDSRRIVVSYKRKYAHELSQACQWKSMVCKTDRLNMNKAFDWDVKNQIQQADKATQISTMNLIWVTSRENQTLLHAYTKDVDQPVNSRSLVSVFAIDPMKRIITTLIVCKISIF